MKALSNTTAVAFMTCAIALAFAPSFAAAQPPGLAKDLIDSAAQTGDVSRVQIVTDAVRDVLPTFRAEIDAYANAAILALKEERAKSGGSEQVASIATPAPTPEPTPEPAPEPASAAASKVAPTPKGLFSISAWDGTFSAGASFASGNSDNAALGLSVDAKRKSGTLTHNVRTYFNLGEAAGTLNQKRWGAAYKLDIAINDSAYTFGRISYDEDEFSGFDYRLFVGGGVGYFIAKSEPFTLKLEGGPGYRYSPIDDTREIDQTMAVYSAIDLDWIIREGLKFTQDVMATWTDPTSTVETTTAITADLWGGLNTGLSFYYRYETNPPAGRGNDDTVVRATLGYSF